MAATARDGVAGGGLLLHAVVVGDLRDVLSREALNDDEVRGHLGGRGGIAAASAAVFGGGASGRRVRSLVEGEGWRGRLVGPKARGQRVGWTVWCVCVECKCECRGRNAIKDCS